MIIEIPDWKIAKWVTDMSMCGELYTEEGHISADAILCDILKELGLSQVADEYDKLPKWYS